MIDKILTKWESIPIEYQYAIIVFGIIWGSCFSSIVKGSILEMGTQERKYSSPFSMLISFIVLSILVPLGLILYYILMIIPLGWVED
jgi:hypothetical protein